MWKKIILTIFLSILAVGIIGENVLATQYYQIIDIGTLSGAVSSYPSAINNNGQVVGFCGFIDETTQAFIWQDYTITNLGGLPGRSQSRALGINDMEQIVGDADTLGPVYDRRAVLFDSSGNGANVDLGTLGGVGSTALGNNNSGQIVGISKTTGSSKR